MTRFNNFLNPSNLSCPLRLLCQDLPLSSISSYVFCLSKGFFMADNRKVLDIKWRTDHMIIQFDFWHSSKLRHWFRVIFDWDAFISIYTKYICNTCVIGATFEQLSSERAVNLRNVFHIRVMPHARSRTILRSIQYADCLWNHQVFPMGRFAVSENVKSRINSRRTYNFSFGVYSYSCSCNSVCESKPMQSSSLLPSALVNILPRVYHCVEKFS